MDYSKLRVNLVRSTWEQCRRVPGGRGVFSRVIGTLVPYTGSIHADVEELREGYARVAIRQHRAITNHLNSVHAVALMNLGEMVTGLAVMYLMPASMRGIPVELSMEYEKKARGRITAEATVDAVEEGVTTQREVFADLKDESGAVVARFRARWQLSPKG